MKSEKIRASLWGLLSGIYLMTAFVNPYDQEISLSEVILQLSGSRGSFVMGCSLPELLGYMLRMLPCYAVSMVWGIDLYRHFCTAGVYVFSRCTNRLKWYRSILISLFVKVCIFETVLTGTVILLSSFCFRMKIRQDGLIILGCHLSVFLLWNFIWILLMNLLALVSGSSMAAVVVMGIQTICLAGLGAAGFLEAKHASDLMIEKLVQLNPISCTVLGWQSEGTYSMKSTHALLFLAMCCIFVIIAGGILIHRSELLTDNREMEMM